MMGGTRLKKSIRVFKYCLILPLKSAPIVYIVFLFTSLISAIAPAIEMLIWKKILDLLQLNYVLKNIQYFIFLVSAYVVLSIFSRLMDKVGISLEEKLIDKIQLIVDVEIINQYMQLDAEFYDNPENLDELDLVKNSKMSISEGVLWPVKIIKALLYYFSVTLLLFSFSPALSIIYIVLSLPQAISSIKLEMQLNQNDINTMEEQRKKEYYKTILIDKEYAKDLRVYRSKIFFINKYRKEWVSLLNIKRNIYQKIFKKIYVNEMFHTLGYIILIISAFYKALIGSLSIGDISVVINATKASSEAFNELFESFMQFTNITVTRIDMYFKFLERKPRIRGGVIECPTSFDVEFVNVTFRYPTEKENTLENISFEIKNGTKNAIVGKNGEGKSTIIKLLLRLYDPQLGEILLNGINIKEYDLRGLRKQFAVCLQEVTKFALTVKENITFGNTEKDESDMQFVASFSGIAKKVNTFNKRFETKLTREFFNEGEELSGGEWQMLAISRALYKKTDFWIMDEPSAALDPLYEDKVMDLFAQCSDEKTTLIVSHRLSSLQDYDQIIVLDNKEIAEVGKHKQLIVENGLYAKMFKLQKSKYGEEQI